VAGSGGAPDSEDAFYLEGSGFEDWGALARLRGCWDVSSFKGIRFWAKGSITNMVFEARIGVPSSLTVVASA
jgi:hypothetical protein